MRRFARHSLVRRLVAAFAFTTIGLFAPTEPRASVAPPVSVRWTGAIPQSSAPGSAVDGAFEIRAASFGTIQDLRLEGEGWSVQSLAGPRARVMAPGETLTVEFRATPALTDEPLVARFTFDGAPVQETFRLDAVSLAKAGRARAAIYADPAGPRLEGTRTPRARGGQQIHIEGRFTYVRGDGTTLGGDGVVVRLWDDDGISDEMIWSGKTGSFGYFSADVNWDDCDELGCDDPDLYLEFETNDGDIDVHDDDLGQTTYTWETPEISDFEGSSVNFGNILPGDSGDYGAVHVFTSIVRARRHAFEKAGIAPPHVEVFWPDADATAYSIADEDIYIQSGETWNEGTHTHEFGHHIENSVGTLTPPNYNNGFCDPGHCVWCPENLVDAWQEGWANWFGGLVNRTYQSEYGTAPQSLNDGRYFLEASMACGQDNNTYGDATTEGFVGMLLWDMDDIPADDHDGGDADCFTDAMAIGEEEILAIIRDGDPVDVLDFVAKFRVSYPQFDHDLYATTRNVGSVFSFPQPTPIVTSDPDDCNLVEFAGAVSFTVQGNGSLLKYQWRLNGANVMNDANVSGATTPTLTIAAMLPQYSGTYVCRVTTCEGVNPVDSAPIRVSLPEQSAQSPLVSWGENTDGQAGNGTTTNPAPPFMHPGLNDFVDVDAGRFVSIAVRQDGSVWSWGREIWGELGNGPPFASLVTTPTPIAGLGNVAQVAANTFAMLALRGDGTVYGWGSDFGQFGMGTFQVWASPMPIPVADCITAIAAGDQFALLLRGDGTVLAAGSNSSGELGSGSFSAFRATYAPVTGLTDVVKIAAESYTAYALKSDGTVWAWGDNASGRLGNADATFADRATPVQVVGLPAMKAVYATSLNGFATAVSGAVFAWGQNFQGSIGDGDTSSPFRTTPVLVPALVNPREIDGGTSCNLALMQDNTMRAWGNNSNAIFGAALPASSPVPIPVPGLANVTGFGTGWSTVHAFGIIAGATGIDEIAAAGGRTPTALALAAPAPNPVRTGRATSLAFDLPASGPVRLAIYDVAGRLVRTVVNEPRAPGRFTAPWDGRDEAGRAVGAGVYFVRLEAAGVGSATRKVTRVE